MGKEQASSWRGWCTRDRFGCEVVVDVTNRGERSGKASCVCTLSGKCYYEDKAVKSRPPFQYYANGGFLDLYSC